MNTFSPQQLTEFVRLMNAGDLGDIGTELVLTLRADGFATLTVDGVPADYAMDRDGFPVDIGEDGRVVA